MKAQQFTKETLRAIRLDVDAAMVAIAQKHGLVSINLGNISFNNDEGTFTGKLIGKLAKSEEAVKAAGEPLSMVLGYNKNVVGLSFKHDGFEWTVESINLRKSKRPFMVRKHSDGKLYEFPNVMRLPFSDPSITWKKTY